MKCKNCGAESTVQRNNLRVTTGVGAKKDDDKDSKGKSKKKELVEDEE